MTLNPLAFPKGVKYLCELCHQIAYLVCTDCNVTYYCCKNHQAIDWEAIHEKICERLSVLRKPLTTILNKQERIERDEKLLAEKIHMIEFTHLTAQRYLYEGKEHLAMPAAMQCLNFALMVYGADDLQLVPCCVLLAETNIGVGRVSQAEEHLAQASWNVLKAPQTPPAIKSQVHRSWGRLHTTTGNYTQALQEFAEDIYQSSLEYGPDDVHTSGGYYYMASVFFLQGKRLVADSLYRQVTLIWYEHLDRIFKYRIRIPPEPRGVGPGIVVDDVPEVPNLEEIQESEAMTFLTTIHKLRMKQVHCPPQELLVVCLTLGILHFLLNHHEQAMEFGKKAEDLSRQNPESHYSHNAQHFLTVLNNFST